MASFETLCGFVSGFFVAQATLTKFGNAQSLGATSPSPEGEGAALTPLQQEEEADG